MLYKHPCNKFVRKQNLNMYLWKPWMPNQMPCIAHQFCWRQLLNPIWFVLNEHCKFDVRWLDVFLTNGFTDVRISCAGRIGFAQCCRCQASKLANLNASSTHCICILETKFRLVHSMFQRSNILPSCPLPGCRFPSSSFNRSNVEYFAQPVSV